MQQHLAADLPTCVSVREETPAPPPRTRIGRLRARRSLAATFSVVAGDRPRAPPAQPRSIRTPLDLLESLASESTHQEFTTSGQFQSKY